MAVSVRTPVKATMRKIIMAAAKRAPDDDMETQDDADTPPKKGGTDWSTGPIDQDNRQYDMSSGALLGVNNIGKRLSGAYDSAKRGAYLVGSDVGKASHATDKFLKEQVPGYREGARALGKVTKKAGKATGEFIKDKAIDAGLADPTDTDAYRRAYKERGENNNLTRAYGAAHGLTPKKMRQIEDDVNGISGGAQQDMKAMRLYHNLQKQTKADGSPYFSDAEIDHILSSNGEKVVKPSKEYLARTGKKDDGGNPVRNAPSAQVGPEDRDAWARGVNLETAYDARTSKPSPYDTAATNKAALEASDYYGTDKKRADAAKSMEDLQLFRKARVAKIVDLTGGAAANASKKDTTFLKNEAARQGRLTKIQGMDSNLTKVDQNGNPLKNTQGEYIMLKARGTTPGKNPEAQASSAESDRKPQFVRDKKLRGKSQKKKLEAMEAVGRLTDSQYRDYMQRFGNQ